MNRRHLLQTGLATTAGALTPTPARAAESRTRPAAKAVRFYAGHQHDHSEATLKLLAALGVTRICSGQLSPKLDENWSVEGLTRLRRYVEAFGIQLAGVPLPMSSRPLATVENPNLLLGKSPERDREIADLQQMIRNAGRAGIPMLKYNFTLLGVVRTGRTVGRGGARLSTFVYDQAPQEPPLTEAGPVSDDQMWERITYFLDKVVPVAEEAKVRLALHPNDPGMPKDRGFRGVHCPLGTVEGLQRFVQTHPSPYHGLNFCQGTVSEMLRRPGEEIYDVIRWFGSRGKIFNVHFRNIRGGFLNFQETFPDDGDVDMLRALRTYQEVGYQGMIMPDHVPVVDGDTGGRASYAFCFGYIQALIQALKSGA